MVTYPWPATEIFSVGYYSPTPAHNRAQHSTARQTSAQQSLPESMADQQITQHSCSLERTHTHSTAQPCSTAHSREVQHIPHHSTMSTEHTRARCFARTAQPYSGILHVPVMFIMALQLGVCLRGSYVSSRMGQLKTSMIRRRSKESIDR